MRYNIILPYPADGLHIGGEVIDTFEASSLYEAAMRILDGMVAGKYPAEASAEEVGCAGADDDLDLDTELDLAAIDAELRGMKQS